MNAGGVSRETTSLVPLLDRLKDARACVVGDVLLDRWVYGRVERISPEAPVPVFVQERVEERPGGAGNVAANIAALGIPDDRNVLVGDWRPKPIKERFIVGRQQIFRRDFEKVQPLTPDQEDAVLAAAIITMPGCLILSDYGKGVLTPSLCHRLIEWARARGIPSIVDPKGPDWEKYSGATIITPNHSEWWEAEYGTELEVDAVLITRGAEGMTLCRRCPVPEVHIPARRREVYDVTGAGDTVVAVLGACLSVGIGLEDAARIANAAAGVVVSKPGTAVCTLDELREELAR